MIEAAGALFRFLQLSSNMILIGGCVLLAIAEGKRLTSDNPYLTRLKRALPWFALTLVLGLLGLLAATTAQATGISENLWHPGTWLGFLQKTKVGFIWTLREASALVVLGLAWFARASPSASWRYVVCAVAASLTLTIGTFASHPAAEEQSIVSILPYALHLIGASVWFGGLPGVLAVLIHAANTHSQDARGRSGMTILKQFSSIALPLMIGIVVTGLVVADRMVGGNYAALFATTYGWLLNTKLTLLAVILSIAGRAHFVWLPALERSERLALPAWQYLRKKLTVELSLAVVLVVVATLLANAVPAKHETIDQWPYPFRFSIDATWGDWLVQTVVSIGIALLILTGTMIVLGRTRQWGVLRRIVLPTLLGLLGIASTFYPIAVQSYPETYRKTPVPFDAISIANGAGLFAANCIPCHGPQAKGNGVLAKTLPKQPVDLLTEPHTAMHTAGDFFHWLTYGRFNGVMPAFGEKFSEEERWDLLNFLHANARGYQARIINSRILPEQPFMVSPNFSYSTQDGSSGTLKDFRGKQSVLLVLFSWPESKERLAQLQTASLTISGTNTAIVAVPINDLSPNDIEALSAYRLLPIVTQGANEITRSYALFRRTITKPDLFAEGAVPKHMEFLFDRYGFLRARWIPEGESPGWSDHDLLLQQIQQLSRERELLPPPGDHVH